MLEGDPEQGVGFGLFAQINPDADEIIEEAKKRAYDDYKDGEFRRKKRVK